MAHLSALQDLTIEADYEAQVYLHGLPPSLQRMTVNGGKWVVVDIVGGRPAEVPASYTRTTVAAYRSSALSPAAESMPATCADSIGHPHMFSAALQVPALSITCCHGAAARDYVPLSV